MDLLNSIVVKTKYYKDFTKDEIKSLMNVLSISFGNNLDPNLHENTLIVQFYFKTYLIGAVCCLDNYYLSKISNDFYSDRESYYIDYEKKGIFIYNLCIIKSCRRKKLGYKLIEVLINKFKNKIDYFHVQIFNNNIGSIKIFKNHGFELKKELKDGDYNKFSVYCKFF